MTELAQPRSHARSEWAPTLTPAQLSWRVALATVVSALLFVALLAANADGRAPSLPAASLRWLVTGDLALGVISLLIVARYRRRYPWAVALGTSALSAISVCSAGPGAWAMASVATRRRWQEILSVALVSMAATYTSNLLYPQDSSWWSQLAWSALVAGIVLATGYGIGSRRALAVSRQDLLEAWKERAQTLEREHSALGQQARIAERTRIAREMHDVLAHRISLVAMHAGALEYRTDLSPEQTQQAARTIAENSQQALADLRQVLGVLRDSSNADSVEAPQPTARNLPGLIQQEIAVGQQVELKTSTHLTEIDDFRGRAIYRLVQECLTNARKHAAGAPVLVSVDTVGPDELAVEVFNLAPPLRAEHRDMPRSGLGLIGLRERIELVGGSLEAAPTREGGFRVRAWLPSHQGTP